MALHVLFVCTGNICRSPIAERLAAAYGARLQIPGFITSSAGTRAVVGHPVHDDAARVLEKMGGDTSHFAARQLTPRIASEPDLILTMTRAHRDTVLELAPQRLRTTFTLDEASRLASGPEVLDLADLAAHRPHVAGHRDIPDPIGKDPKFFANVGSQIAERLTPLMELFRRMSIPPVD